MIGALLLVPLLGGAAAFLVPRDGVRRGLLVGGALGHAALTAVAWIAPASPALGGWLRLDALGLLFLSIVSALFLAAAAYAAGSLARERGGSSERVFTGCLLLFLATMTLTCVSHRFGLLWVGIEATTLASAPLIYFHRTARSLEAVWKYLMICSVGIALALLGTFVLAVAATDSAGRTLPLVVEDLTARGAGLDHGWLRAAFLLLLVGYGTKAGLAPLHTWLPDAHSESPSVVSALLSGALLNCALLGILRGFAVCAAAGLGGWAQAHLLGFGLLSMAVAAVFLLRQPDYKRLLAYSSVEHMGVLAVGVGLGGGGTEGAMLHAVNHSLSKAALFLTAGNILAASGTKEAGRVRGLLAALPASGALWLGGLLAIGGAPPFGTFLSEFAILRAALDAGRGWVAAAYLALLAVAFVGMATVMLRMVQGRAERGGSPAREPWSAVLPPLGLGIAVLVLGLWVPAGLRSLLAGAARAAGAP